MVKLDADTGKTVQIEGTTFKIRDLSTNEYVGYWEWNPLPMYVTEWTTTDDGTVMTGDVLQAGEYQIEEIKAPNGYVLNEGPVKFKVSSNTAYETLPDGSTPVITVKMSDQAVKGKIQIEKRGEVLVDFKDGQFIYEERGLRGMTAEVIASEDILDPSKMMARFFILRERLWIQSQQIKMEKVFRKNFHWVNMRFMKPKLQMDMY